ncbi:9940_t:CDS:1, partial [Cetraspora pellucida]
EADLVNASGEITELKKQVKFESDKTQDAYNRLQKQTDIYIQQLAQQSANFQTKTDGLLADIKALKEKAKTDNQQIKDSSLEKIRELTQQIATLSAELRLRQKPQQNNQGTQTDTTSSELRGIVNIVISNLNNLDELLAKVHYLKDHPKQEAIHMRLNK